MPLSPVGRSLNVRPKLRTCVAWINCQGEAGKDNGVEYRLASDTFSHLSGHLEVAFYGLVAYYFPRIVLIEPQHHGEGRRQVRLSP